MDEVMVCCQWDGNPAELGKQTGRLYGLTVVKEQSCLTLVPSLCSDRMVSGGTSFPGGLLPPKHSLSWTALVKA